MMMKIRIPLLNFILILLLFYSCSTHENKEISKSELKSGDLIFQNLDCGNLCEAIEQVTTGYEGMKFSHIGIVFQDSHGTRIYEAIPPVVRISELDSFLMRSTHTTMVGRLSDSYQPDITPALRYIQEKLNSPYDDSFLMDNESYYCSELIYDAFDHNKSDNPFQLFPMTFHSSDNQHVDSIWARYYHALAMPVPEGRPGINPAGISKSSSLQWVKKLNWK